MQRRFATTDDGFRVSVPGYIAARGLRAHGPSDYLCVVIPSRVSRQGRLLRWVAERKPEASDERLIAFLFIR